MDDSDLEVVDPFRMIHQQEPTIVQEENKQEPEDKSQVGKEGEEGEKKKVIETATRQVLKKNKGDSVLSLGQADHLTEE